MFNFDDILTPEGVFTNYFRSYLLCTLFGVIVWGVQSYLLCTLFGIIVWGVAFNELRNPAQKRAREPKFRFCI